MAANKGDSIAKYNLSFLYELGEGVDKDEKKAFKLLEELAEKDDVNARCAQCKLGDFYSKGIGTDVNKSKAFYLYKVAANEEIILHDII